MYMSLATRHIYILLQVVRSMDEESDNELDRFVESIQRKIYREEEAIYSEEVICEYRNPQNVGQMSDPDASAILTGPCGDTMEFYLKMEEGRVKDIVFMTDGCGPSIACGSKLTKMVKGKKIDDTRAITKEDLLIALGGLPDESKHCAKLAVDTLQKALKN